MNVKIIAVLGFSAILFIGFTTIAMSSGSGSSSSQNTDAQMYYQKGMEFDKAGDFKSAFQYFQQAYNRDSKNPDVLNMLAHSQRKLGMIDEALVNYKKALTLRPDFADAREYLGEAYIQAALRELDTLKAYGKNGDEQRTELINAFRQAMNGLQ
jgi:tetratricopeptide (TPR) repeat protein